jgi:hypothetical protein
MQSSLSFIHVYILNTQVDQLIFLMSDKITISHLSHIKVDNSISNQVKHVRVNFYTSTYMQSFYSVVSSFEHRAFWVCHTHMWSCQWSGIESERRRQLMLSMFNQTPHVDEWYSSLIVVKSGTTFISFDIYINIQKKKWDRIVKQHLHLFLFSLINLLRLQAVQYPFILSINIIYYSLSLNEFLSSFFNCPTDVQKEGYHLAYHFLFFSQCICHVFRICYACLDLKERLNLHFQTIWMIYHVFLYTKNVCWWDVISNADVFHTRSMSFYAFIVCVCVFCSSSSLDNFYF